MKNIFFTTILFAIIISCGDDDGSTQDPCASDLICTEEYRSILLTLEDSSGSPVILDAYTVTDEESGTIVDFSTLDFFGEGAYVIAEDSQFESVDMDGTSFIFEGFINEESVVTASFLIGHDCCHIVKINGPDSLVVDF